MVRNYPECVTFKDAADSKYEPKTLSSQSTLTLSNRFVEVDRRLKHGFSRLLISELFGMSNEEQDAFFKESGM